MVLFDPLREFLRRKNQSMTISTIIFDFGNVLYRPPSLAWFRRWKKLLGLDSNPQLEGLISNPDSSDYMRDVFLGKIPEKKMWEDAVEHLGLNKRIIDFFYKRFSTKKRLNQPMVELLKELHQNHQTAILSNASDEARTLIVDVLELDRWVELIIISAEEKMVKPDSMIYELTLNRLGAKPETCLFIDDQPQNIEAAKALGMQAIQFTQNELTIPAIRSLLDGEE